MKILREITYKKITACHYMDGKKYKVWFFMVLKDKKKIESIVDYQIRGLKEPLTEGELKIHIEKVIERLQEINKERKEKGIKSDIVFF